MTLLAARLLRQQEESDLSKLTSERREQIGWAKRAEKMRTYNFPQDRVTDHRIGLTLHNLGEVMDGHIDELVQALIATHQAELLKESTGS